MWVQSLGGEDPPRRKWQASPVVLLGKYKGQRSLVGYSPWGHKELDVTEANEPKHNVCTHTILWIFLGKERDSCFNQQSWVSLVAQTVKSMPTIQETQVQSLGQEDPLEKEMATHSSILAWKVPWMEEPGGLYSPRGRKGLDTTEPLTHTHVSRELPAGGCLSLMKATGLFCLTRTRPLPTPGCCAGQSWHVPPFPASPGQSSFKECQYPHWGQLIQNLLS